MITRQQAGLPPLPRLPAVTAHPGVIVHCTGGSSRPADVAHGLARVRIIHASHTAERGWAYAGYHFVILPGGELVQLRGFNVRGAHAKGHNRWLGVCVLGRGLEMTAAEQTAIADVAALVGGAVLPHNAISRKSCPGPAVTAWVRERWPEG
jgi:hypothetical protein